MQDILFPQVVRCFYIELFQKYYFQMLKLRMSLHSNFKTALFIALEKSFTHMNFLLLAQTLFRFQINNIMKANNTNISCILRSSLISIVFGFFLYILAEGKSRGLLCSCKQHLQPHLSTQYLLMLERTVMKNTIWKVFTTRVLVIC